MRITSNDLRGAYGLATLATAHAVRPLTAVDARAQRDKSPAWSPVERVLEGELLRQNPVAAVESILTDARSVLFARVQVVTTETPRATTPVLAPFAVLFYQQHSSPEQLVASTPGQHVNQFV
jgi:hypothetical protein